MRAAPTKSYGQRRIPSSPRGDPSDGFSVRLWPQNEPAFDELSGATDSSGSRIDHAAHFVLDVTTVRPALASSERSGQMHYFVRMRLASSSRPTAPEDGAPFIERVVLPTLEQCQQLQDAQRIVAGGPTTGADTLLFVVNADSIQELDEVITGLPVWPRMETEIVPLTTFDGHAQALRSKLANLRMHPRDGEVASAAAGPRRLWNAQTR